MNDLSLNGIARKYCGIKGGFSVVKNIVGVSSIAGSVSLRSKLESVAREEYSFEVSECIYGWPAAFEQTWTHIRVRIKLNPEAGISNATTNALRTIWQNGIQNTWSNQWGCGRSGELTCRLTFEVQWVTTNQHHTVQVLQGSGRSIMRTWFTTLSGGGGAHEFGHMLGHPDEYPDMRCPERSPVNTGTVMDNTSPNVPARLMARFANNIGSNVVGISALTSLIT